ncbi:MAG: hypothetical protein K6E62_08500 [Lachnospiraceae bacterium]|nr:hypothetical protein [Lachnospiraceae bacterium]
MTGYSGSKSDRDKDNVITTGSIIFDHCTGWFNLTGICVKEYGARTLCVLP